MASDITTISNARLPLALINMKSSLKKKQKRSYKGDQCLMHGIGYENNMVTALRLFLTTVMAEGKKGQWKRWEAENIE